MHGNQTTKGISENLHGNEGATLGVHLVTTRIKNIKNVTRCRDSSSAKSIETR